MECHDSLEQTAYVFSARIIFCFEKLGRTTVRYNILYNMYNLGLRNASVLFIKQLMEGIHCVCGFCWSPSEDSFQLMGFSIFWDEAFVIQPSLFSTFRTFYAASKKRPKKKKI